MGSEACSNQYTYQFNVCQFDVCQFDVCQFDSRCDTHLDIVGPPLELPRALADIILLRGVLRSAPINAIVSGPRGTGCAMIRPESDVLSDPPGFLLPSWIPAVVGPWVHAEQQ